MSRLWWLMAGAALVAGAARCTYPTFTFDGTTTGGGGGGSGSTKSTTSTASSTGTTGGTGGASPKACSTTHQDCTAGLRCTVVDTNTGDTGCVPIDPKSLAPFDACPNGDQRCPKGTWCDGRTQVCSPFCASKTDCASLTCIGASDGTSVIPNDINVCTAHCDPIDATPCGQGATCAYDKMALDFDCFETQDAGWMASCQFSRDCGKGFVCGLDSMGNGTCFYWCEPAGQSSSICLGQTCNGFTNALSYNGVEYGYCTN